MTHSSIRSFARLATGLGILLALASALGCVTSPDQQVALDQDKKARTHYNAGIQYMSEGKLAIAIRELRSAMDVSPRDPWIHWAIAEAYRRAGPKAVAGFRQVLEAMMDPDMRRHFLALKDYGG